MKRDIHFVGRFDVQVRERGGVESLLLDAKLIRTSGEIGEEAVSGEIGFATNRKRLRRGGKRSAGRGHSHSILICDRDFEHVGQLGRRLRRRNLQQPNEGGQTGKHPRDSAGSKHRSKRIFSQMEVSLPVPSSWRGEIRRWGAAVASAGTLTFFS
jgi:hypothetical protein